MNAITNPSSPAHFLPTRTIVIVGMMGAGKSSIGRKLAARLALPFADSDSEIEAAAGMSITRIFEQFGEAEFRKGERRVLTRLLQGPMQVLATGGGAFMDPEIRALIKERAVSVWLKADLKTLLERTTRRNDRPLLKGGEPGEILQKLMAEREPIYAGADITVDSDERPSEEAVERILCALEKFSRERAALKGQKQGKGAHA